MVTKVYLIRHGETEDAEARRYKGHFDVPLSKRGIEQMERVSKFLMTEDEKWKAGKDLNCLDPIYCSDLKRAIQSAEIIARPFGLRPIIVSDLRERNFGEWEGMAFGEIEEKWPDTFRAWAENPLKHSPPGGESTIEVRDRVMRALNRILSSYSNTGEVFTSCSSIVIVAHGGVNRIILCELLGMPLENIFRIEQDFGALNIIEFYDRYPIVKHINYIVQTL